MTEPTRKFGEAPNFELLHALVDGELTDAERADAISWITNDEQAAQEYAVLMRLKQVLRDCPPTEADPEVWRRCLGRLNELDRANRTEAFVGRYAWGICSLVFVLIVGGGLLTRMSGHRLGTQDVTSMGASLIPTFQASHPSASSVPRWMSQAIGESPVDRFSGIEVVQADAGEVRGVRLARLVLRDSYGTMVLFVVKDPSAIDGLSPMGEGSGMETGRMGDANCVAWNKEGCALILAGHREVDQLAQVASTISVQPR
jgi:anti-sigma factor RsiW